MSRVRRNLVFAFERGPLNLLPSLPARVSRVLGPLGDETHVLDERAAESDVQDLDSATHAEDREAPFERALGQLELERVAARLGRHQVVGPLLPVEARVDVASAAEQTPVTGVEGVVEISVDARQDQPDASRKSDRALKADAG